MIGAFTILIGMIASRVALARASKREVASGRAGVITSGWLLR